MEYEYTPGEEIRWRIGRFQGLLQENGVAAALISQNADLFYFTGTIQRSFLFVPARGEPVLAVTGNLDRARRESRLSHIVPLKNGHRLGQALAEFDYSIQGQIGLEMDVLPVRHYFTLCQDFPGADFRDVSEYIRQVRMIKSEYEISQIRKGAEILDDVMREAQGSIRSGMTELEVDALLGALARRRGHQGRLRMRGYNQEMFYGHIFCGRIAALPSSMETPLGGLGTTPAIAQGASFNVITSNEPIIIDFGVGINGYVTDMTRTFVIGKLSAELEEAYSFAREVKSFMEGWVKPGRQCSLLYQEAVELARRRGYGDYFMGYRESQAAFIGHGLGLEIDEYPLIASHFHQEFQPNMVFAFEPKLVFPDVGVVGVEDDYLVTEAGVERLTTYDDRVLTIGLL